jgi:hypothetical protein
MADDTAPRAKAPVRRQQKSIRAEAEFRARLVELGVTLLDPYLGNGKPHRAICVNGHPCAPLPWYVKRGGGPCKTCAGTDPKAAEAAFRRRVEELGGTVLQAEWRGTNEPCLVRCVNGHECTPRPHHVMRGTGLCLTCAGQDTRVAEARFREHVARLGGVVTGPWKGTHTRIRVRCAEGHDSSPMPDLVFRRGSICRTCGGRDPDAAWEAFRTRVGELGGVVLEPSWKGALNPHRVRCAQGHEGSPRPASVMHGRNGGQGICRACGGTDPATAEAFFVARVAELEGVLLEPYRSASHRHGVICRVGHKTTVTPNGLRSGEGLCRFCKGKVWDVFYVVQDDLNDVIKFGVTSGDPRPRLGDHERKGFDQVIRLHTGLPGDTAPWLERAIISALRDAREEPVRGREYYRSRVLPVVFDLVDNHPAIRTTR